MHAFTNSFIPRHRRSRKPTVYLGKKKNIAEFVPRIGLRREAGSQEQKPGANPPTCGL